MMGEKIKFYDITTDEVYIREAVVAPAPKPDRADRHEAMKDDPIYQAIDRGGGHACDVLGVMDALAAAGYEVIKAGDPVKVYDPVTDELRPATQDDVKRLEAAANAFGQLRMILRHQARRMEAGELRTLVTETCAMSLDPSGDWIHKYLDYLRDLRAKLAQKEMAR